MNINRVRELADKHGDFYLYYRRNEKGRPAQVTYVVGTMDFDNKYIVAKAREQKMLLPHVVLHEDAVTILNRAQELLATVGKVMVFSWTINKFLEFEVADIRRMTPLSSELQNGNDR